MDFVKLFAEGLGLTVMIFSAVAQLKQFGVKGKWLTVSAYLVGVALGGSYRYFVYAPVLPVDWFWLVMFGLVCGFIATGVYKGVESATGKLEPIKGHVFEGEYMPDVKFEPPSWEQMQAVKQEAEKAYAAFDAQKRKDDQSGKVAGE